MPLYEYECEGCGERFEVLQRAGESGEGVSCPKCGAQRVERVFSTFASQNNREGCGPSGPT
ncbi:MAG: zinc ribbon domain-containing protein [Acidobacteria bacterium]|nr:zinc ribbon domain-containing protein [Acidobacteriota bacterium]